MSAPALNALPAPVRTATLTSSSRSTSSMAASSSLTIRAVKAFSASGRLRVMVATPPATEYPISSNSMVLTSRIGSGRRTGWGTARSARPTGRCGGQRTVSPFRRSPVVSPRRPTRGRSAGRPPRDEPLRLVGHRGAPGPPVGRRGSGSSRGSRTRPTSGSGHRTPRTKPPTRVPHRHRPPTPGGANRRHLVGRCSNLAPCVTHRTVPRRARRRTRHDPSCTGRCTRSGS